MMSDQNSENKKRDKKSTVNMYTAVGDHENVKKINEELETLERACISAQNRVQ